MSLDALRRALNAEPPPECAALDDAQAAEAEIEKLAVLLGAPPDRFGYLEPLGEDAVRALREAATDRLFDADRGLFDRLAAGAAIVPDALAATLAKGVRPAPDQPPISLVRNDPRHNT